MTSEEYGTHRARASGYHRLLQHRAGPEGCSNSPIIYVAQCDPLSVTFLCRLLPRLLPDSIVGAACATSFLVTEKLVPGCLPGVHENGAEELQGPSTLLCRAAWAELGKLGISVAALVVAVRGFACIASKTTSILGLCCREQCMAGESNIGTAVNGY